MVHVHGSVSDGFMHEFKMDCNIVEDSPSKSTALLCFLDASAVTDVKGNGSFTVDMRRMCVLQETALRLNTPSKSLRSASLMLVSKLPFSTHSVIPAKPSCSRRSPGSR